MAGMSREQAEAEARRLVYGEDKGMKIIVCGGRDYTDYEKVYETLDELHAKKPISLVIEGGANGADSLGRAWAITRNVPRLTMKADWKAHGPAAGPIRNGEMLKHSPDMVVAFPGGKGTADMIWQARRADVRILRA